MNLRIISRILGVLLMLFSLTQLAPVGVAWYYQENIHHIFLLAFGLTFLSGAAFWLPNAKQKGELRTRDGFLITALFWLVLSLFGALPFMLSAAPHLSLTDAFFESVSGLTTTGATVITGLDALPRSILYYRQQLQWLGGIGIVVIAVAILPMLGIGGMQLYKAETTGPMKDSKLTPRITSTAKALFTIYLLMTIACAACYWLAGMGLFDAIAHSMSTVATGGFSTHDASMGYFASDAIKCVAIAFMFIGSINFSLHFIAWQHGKAGHYLNNPEYVFYALVLSIASILISIVLAATQTLSLHDSVINGMFQAVSFASTTGFQTHDYSAWPGPLPWLLLLLGFMGGCGSSTAGGIKVVRVLLIFKQGLRELKQLIHPNAVFLLKLGAHTVSDRVIMAVWSFFSVYVLLFIAMMLLLLASGLDFVTAFSTVGSAISNVGPAAGEASSNWASLNDFAKWALALTMITGRLEIFTVLVLLSPAFWRR
ncbi:MAG TPA: TrkH family potassium uptake protein [Pseudomonadales bacterium]|jgi:trk system potassium uptake protein TrkH